MAGNVIHITPKKFAQQWLLLSNKFEVNVFNFETLAGNAAKKVFKDSFYLRRFNTTGAFAWKPRKDYKPHPLLEETGALKNSIMWLREQKGKARSVHLFTSPDIMRYSKRQYGRDFCYAAIHNAGGASVGATGNAAHIPQRQFIGYSTVLDDKLKSYCIRLFDGFPK